MFLVPKYLVNEDGSLGERNGVKVTNVEHKMGLKVSTTCELTFGGDPGRPAVGTLVGGVHDGIRQMFMIIEHARMMVGSKAIETLSTGYLNALDYAKNRVQGPDLTRQLDKTSPRVTIIHHPDVRRMLMLQKAYAEGMRALVLYTATQQDAVQLAEANGTRDAAAAARNDLLLPRGQGRRVRAGVRDAHAVAADARRLGLPAGLPDRAVHQGLEDRLPVRGHHRASSRSTSSSARWSATRAAAVKALLAEIAAFAAARRRQRRRPAQDRAGGHRRGRRPGRGDAHRDDRLRDRLVRAAGGGLQGRLSSPCGCCSPSAT